MAPITEPTRIGSLAEETVPYPITSDLFQEMIERGLIPEDRRVFLRGGRLYEKTLKTTAQAAVHNAFNQALARRLSSRLFLWNANPVRLDDTHLPLPDLVVARGAPFDFYDTRYPDGRDFVLVIEIALRSLPDDLGPRLARYALTLPSAQHVVAALKNHQVMIHSGPNATGQPGEGSYSECVVVRTGEAIRLKLDGVDLDPIPFEEVMR